jgi:putative component of membrane protein insertase Oxa1/YidC/SpoIIIJ protein YidD
MKFFLIIFLLAIAKVFAQTDWVKWGKANYSYELPNYIERNNYSLDEKNWERNLLKVTADAYWIFISDVDGDNCSFNPTCSHFFVQSVKMTNIFQGTLMFFDRFTRDSDIFGKVGMYPRVKDGHFYDPPSLYLLDKNKINYFPPSAVVNN